jgi:hypothetical protein
MKRGKANAKKKSETAKKSPSPKTGGSRTAAIPVPLTAEGIMADFRAFSKRTIPDLIGEEIVEHLGNLVTSAREHPENVAPAIERIVNRAVEVLRTIEGETVDPMLRKEVQDQMVFSARRFSDAAFGVLERIPQEASKVMTLSLVKYITGQIDHLRKACEENPQTFRWIAEQTVFWPSIRGLYATYDDDFDGLKSRLNLGGKLPLNRKPSREPNMNTPAFQEVTRILLIAGKETFSPPLPHTKNAIRPIPWGKIPTFPALPPLSKRTLPSWRKRLSQYLEANKKRLIESGKFNYVRGRARVKGKNDNEALVWAEIKKDCFQMLRTIAPPKAIP